MPFKAGVNLCMQLSSFSILAVTASATAASFSSAVLSGSSSATGSPVFGPGSAVGFPAKLQQMSQDEDVHTSGLRSLGTAASRHSVAVGTAANP